MTALKDAFEERVVEVGNFFLLLEMSERSRPRDSDATLSDSTLPMLKATAFLVLYNLVEASMRDGIASIYDALGAARVPFDDLVPSLRLVVATNIRQTRAEQISAFTDLSRDVVADTFAREELFSGNVDARKIRELAKAYGFARPHANGDDLLTVKSARNDLGHGTRTFREVGREHTVHDLLLVKDRVVGYLRETMASIDTYIQERRYLLAPHNDANSSGEAPAEARCV